MKNKEPISDKWILDLSTNDIDRSERASIFQSFIDNRSPVWFGDHKRKNYNYLSFFSWDDTSFISSNPNIFSSKQGYMINDNFEGIPFTGSLLSMDGLEHKKARSIISSVFTRSRILELEPMIRSVTKEAFENFINDSKSGDIYNDLCLQIPLEINRRMMGVLEEEKNEVVELTKYVIGNDDPRYGNGDPIVWMQSCRKLKRYSLKLARQKLSDPGDDLTSILLNTTGDSGFLSKEEFAQFFMLLVIAGMETTTHTLAHGVRLLSENKEQKEMLEGNFEKHIDTACEEILRFEPPVLYFRRTTVDSLVLNDLDIEPGTRVAMWYNCANRDPQKFYEPNRFLIDRPKRPSHTTFGGPGIHHCLGAQLARLEMKVFYELFIEYFSEINFDRNKILYGKSRWGNGFRSFPVSYEKRRL